MTETPRYIRINVVVHSASSATMRRQGLFEMRGWRKWFALLLSKPVSEWRDLDNNETEVKKP